MHVLNPKSINQSELLGSFNPVTNEWVDGLAARIIRAAVADGQPTMHWVVFDGPVDAGWVESLNTGKCFCTGNRSTCQRMMHSNTIELLEG